MSMGNCLVEGGSRVKISAMIRQLKLISIYEASKEYDLSLSYFRILCLKGRLKAERIEIAKKKTLWLIYEPSILAFLKTKRSPGRPKKK